MIDNLGELSEDVKEVRDDEVTEDKRVFLGACLMTIWGEDCTLDINSVSFELTGMITIVSRIRFRVACATGFVFGAGKHCN